MCNTAVWHVNTAVVHNTYVDRTVIKNVTVNRVSFNGPGGIEARPTADEEAAAREQHLEATQEQRTHEETSIHDNNQRFSVNKGNPTKTAVTKVDAREQVAATPAEERKEANKPETTKEETTNKEQTTKAEPTKGNEPATKGGEEKTKEKEHPTKTEVKSKESAPPEKREEKAKAETQKGHHETDAKPTEEKAKGEKGKSEKKDKDKQQ
jgi:hypothetical protein